MKENQQNKWKATFFPIWIGQAIGLLGGELVQFSLIWQLVSTSRSVSVLAGASIVALLPRVILAPISGVLIDRWNRKIVMLIADGLIAVTTGLLAISFLLDTDGVLQIYFLLFIRAMGCALRWPAMQAATGEMIPRSSIGRISRLNHSLRSTLGIISPLISAILLLRMKIEQILFIDILATMFAMAPLLILKAPELDNENAKTKAAPNLLGELKNSVKFLFNWQGLFYLIVAAALINFLIHPGFTFLPLLVTDHFNKGVIALSMIESTFSAGMILGGLIMTAWGGFRRNIHTILFGIAGLAIGSAVISAAPSNSFFIALAGVGIAGLMNPIANGPIFAILQTYVQPSLQRGVFSLLESIISAMMLVSMLVAVPITRWIGIRGWLVVGAIGCAVIGIGGFFNPTLLRIEDGCDSED